MAAFFIANTSNTNFGQLYKLGFDNSVTKWTDINAANFGLFASDLTFFSNAVLFDSATPNLSQDFQIYKLGFDGSVTKWTALNTAGGALNPNDLTTFNNALWFNGQTSTEGQQLFKLGDDGSVTKWTALNTAGG